ncbi:MAG: efflux RND transporter periplasmic adaptor subunit [Candidatus Cloacimonetes bacterium HGW-Cloacimonetes-3]|jgi:HlyD family secretion protein|nr:MAG: efflux RND transporter periplasmic adaptor subunit [Candidatus Cloacimonetes bacterium HGW-Cloacimonetes-3]
MKKYIKYIVIVLVIVAAIVMWSRFSKQKNQPEWRMDKPSEGSIREVVTATGSLNPYVLVNVGTEVSGKIDKLYKDFNDRVKKGELLAKLDTEILRTNLDAAKGDLAKANTAMDEAKLDYDLLKELYKKNMTPEYDVKKAQFKYETSQQNVANAKLNLQRAQKNLNNASITSPIDGIIVSRDVDEGQTVAASMSSPTLFMIANNLDQMQITANVDEADIGKVKLGMPVEFTVDAYPTSRFDGSVKQIRLNPSSESNVVSYSVIIDVANPERKLLPGMTTNVTIIIQSKENALRIPETATRFKPSKEIWELFGLKWDEELLNAGRNAMKASAEKAAAEMKNNASDTPKPATAAQAQAPKPGRGAVPDSIKAKFAVKRGGDMASGTNPGMGASGGAKRSRTAVVWVLEGKTPKPVPVKVGISDGANVEVLEGLQANATLLVGVNYKDPKQASANASSPSGPGMGRRF